MGFAIVGPEEAARVREMAGPPGRPGRRPHTRALAALITGEVVHFADIANHFNATQLRRDYRLMVHSRRDGEGGRYWWATPIEP